MTPVATVRGGVSPTLTGDHQNRVTDYTAIVVVIDEESDRFYCRPPDSQDP